MTFQSHSKPQRLQRSASTCDREVKHHEYTVNYGIMCVARKLDSNDPLHCASVCKLKDDHCAAISCLDNYLYSLAKSGTCTGRQLLEQLAVAHWSQLFRDALPFHSVKYTKARDIVCCYLPLDILRLNLNLSYHLQNFGRFLLGYD